MENRRLSTISKIPRKRLQLLFRRLALQWNDFRVKLKSFLLVFIIFNQQFIQSFSRPRSLFYGIWYVWCGTISKFVGTSFSFLSRDRFCHWFQRSNASRCVVCTMNIHRINITVLYSLQWSSVTSLTFCLTIRTFPIVRCRFCCLPIKWIIPMPCPVSR